MDNNKLDKNDKGDIMDIIDNKRIFTFYGEVDIPDSILEFVNGYERAIFAVKTVRDVALFTDRKIIISDKQGITGKKTEYFAIPYNKIVTYSIETAGHFDIDSEIKLTLNGGMEIEMKFMKSKNMDSLLKKAFNTIDECINK